MNISLDGTVEQIACWVDEQLCARNPKVLKLNKISRLFCAVLFLGTHGRDLIDIKREPAQTTITPSEVLLRMLDESVGSMPSRSIEVNGTSGSLSVDGLICVFQLNDFHTEIFGTDCANLVSSYCKAMLPVRQGHMTVGGWNREGRLRLYPTELGRASGQVSRRSFVLSAIGQHLSR